MGNPTRAVKDWELCISNISDHEGVNKIRARVDILKNKVTIQVDVQGLSDLHKKLCELVEVPSSAYKNLHHRWWLFEGT